MFLAKVILKRLINQFPYINRVLWQHVVLCKGKSLRMRLTIGVRSVLRSERLASYLKESLMMLANRVLRKLFGPKRKEIKGDWMHFHKREDHLTRVIE